MENASTNKELFDSACEIVVTQKKQTQDFDTNSFILHAPLEICARYFLLPLVDEEHFSQARQQIINTANKYDELENADKQISIQVDENFSLAGINLDKWVTSLLFAGHAPILAAMQNTLGETNQYMHSILLNMAQTIDSSSSQMKWVDTKASTLHSPQEWIIENIGNIKNQSSKAFFIADIVNTTIESGLIDPLTEQINAIADISSRGDFEIPFKLLMRIAALSMLIEDEEHSKYGWSHCLTLPHAIWSLLNFANDKSRYLKAATIYVASFRSINSKETINPIELETYCEPDELSVFAEHYVRMEEIISIGCTYKDAHLVKYIYTCFDLMKRDPQYAKLYIAAAGKLLSIWENEDSK
ncbi:MAG: hypothetical protein U0R17_01415 [Acidimicrobiia bacterium]